MTTGAVLAPLAARYEHWLSLTPEQVAHDRSAAESDVWAMPLILRMERDSPPVWSAALEAACRAATTLCLDERAEPGGEWHETMTRYLAGHIRKVTRRARASHWHAVGELAGVTVTVGTTEVRALLPGPVDQLDKRVSKLQVGGTDVPADLGPDDTRIIVSKRVILNILASIPMTTGKLMAQTGHAGMICAALLANSDQQALQRWWEAGLPAAVQRIGAERWAEGARMVGRDEGWARRLVAVRDAGFTEIDPGTITVLADASGV